MKKFLIFIMIMLIIGMAVFGIYRWKLSVTPDDSAQREEIEYLNEAIDLAFLLYGEGIDFPEGLEYEHIESLENANWQKENDYVYLIINDLNGTVNIEEEKFLELVKYANQNTNFNFYYIGTDHLNMINENIQDADLDDNDMSFGYIMYEGARTGHAGVWTKHDHQYLEVNPDLLSDNVYSAVLMGIRSNEKQYD